jgi:hypothetical protein
MNEINEGPNKFKTIFSWTAALAIFLVHAIIAYVILGFVFQDQEWIRIAKDHTVATLGIPLAGSAALFLILILKIISGTIEFEIASIKFKGAASQIVLWVFSFLSIIVAIRLLWTLK